MKRVYLLVLLFCSLAGTAGYMWLNHKPYGDPDYLWNKVTQGGKGEGLELSYRVGGRPLDAQSEFFPAAKRLCQENTDAANLAAMKVLDKEKADFLQITFHYGDFFHYARFVVENGKANCEVLYDGQATSDSGSVPKGT